DAKMNAGEDREKVDQPAPVSLHGPNACPEEAKCPPLPLLPMLHRMSKKMVWSHFPLLQSIRTRHNREPSQPRRPAAVRTASLLARDSAAPWQLPRVSARRFCAAILGTQGSVESRGGR